MYLVATTQHDGTLYVFAEYTKRADAERHVAYLARYAAHHEARLHDTLELEVTVIYRLRPPRVEGPPPA